MQTTSSCVNVWRSGCSHTLRRDLSNFPRLASTMTSMVDCASVMPGRVDTEARSFRHTATEPLPRKMLVMAGTAVHTVVSPGYPVAKPRLCCSLVMPLAAWLPSALESPPSLPLPLPSPPASPPAFSCPLPSPPSSTSSSLPRAWNAHATHQHQHRHAESGPRGLQSSGHDKRIYQRGRPSIGATAKRRLPLLDFKGWGNRGSQGLTLPFCGESGGDGRAGMWAKRPSASAPDPAAPP